MQNDSTEAFWSMYDKVVENDKFHGKRWKDMGGHVFSPGEEYKKKFITDGIDNGEIKKTEIFVLSFLTDETEPREVINLSDNDYHLLAIFIKTGGINSGHCYCYLMDGSNSSYLMNDGKNVESQGRKVEYNDVQALLYVKVPQKLNFNDYSRGIDTMTGIQNNGNTCFFNTAVQVLVHLNNYFDWVELNSGNSGIAAAVAAAVAAK